MGLTLPVSIISSIDVGSLLKLIVDSLSVSSSMKGQVSNSSYALFYVIFIVETHNVLILQLTQDIKECLLGRLFAYGALARSGRLLEDWESDKDSQIITEFTNALIGLAAKKRYLQEPAVHVLLDFVVDKV